MKNRSSLRHLLVFAIVCQVLFSGSYANGMKAETFKDKIEKLISSGEFLGLPRSEDRKIVRKMVFGDGIEYVLEIRFSPEMNLKAQDGSDLYMKKVEMLGTYFMVLENKPVKELAKHKCKVNFTYNKKNFCEILNAPEDITCKAKTSSKGEWTIKENNEIIYSKDHSICTVSVVSNLYNFPKNSLKSVYLGNSHIDFICSKYGNMLINSSML